ncbi:MAG: hypothetical protein QGD94_11355, partial [Planctomycetia bacterium]|nr:hypothetical protein [Planctomycetia bacterium]
MRRKIVKMSGESEKASIPSAGLMVPVNPRCEYLENPLGLGARRPRFSWQLSCRKRGQGQTAYRLLVAS